MQCPVQTGHHVRNMSLSPTLISATSPRSAPNAGPRQQTFPKRRVRGPTGSGSTLPPPNQNLFLARERWHGGRGRAHVAAQTPPAGSGDKHALRLSPRFPKQDEISPSFAVRPRRDASPAPAVCQPSHALLHPLPGPGHLVAFHLPISNAARFPAGAKRRERGPP